MQYLFLGCDLELYIPCELPVVYWYLEFLLEIRLQSKHLAHRELTVAKKKKKNIYSYRTVAPRVTGETLLTEACFLLCRGFNQLVNALSRMGFHTEAMRGDNIAREKWFTNRFLLMHLVQQPRPLTIAQFDLVQEQLSKIEHTVLVKRAVECFTAVRNALTKLSALATTPDLVENQLPGFLAMVNNLKRIAATNSLITLQVPAPLCSLSHWCRILFKSVVYSDHRLTRTKPIPKVLRCFMIFRSIRVSRLCRWCRKRLLAGTRRLHANLFVN